MEAEAAVENLTRFLSLRLKPKAAENPKCREVGTGVSGARGVACWAQSHGLGPDVGGVGGGLAEGLALDQPRRKERRRS